jgi:hypothetical protein
MAHPIWHRTCLGLALAKGVIYERHSAISDHHMCMCPGLALLKLEKETLMTPRHRLLRHRRSSLDHLESCPVLSIWRARPAIY